MLTSDTRYDCIVTFMINTIYSLSLKDLGSGWIGVT
jgi:hypothetical protein